MPHSHRAKRQYCHVLAIIPGPKEPTNLAPYLKPLLLDLNEAGPDGKHTKGVQRAAWYEIKMGDCCMECQFFYGRQAKGAKSRKPRSSSGW